MLRRLLIAGLAAGLTAACTSNDEPSASPGTFPVFDTTTTTALPTTPVIGRALSPEKGTVQGRGGRGMVVVLTFTARDATVLTAEPRALLSPAAVATASKPGQNPAFPGLVVGLSSTGTALGGPTANLANLFQVVSPALQLDGSMQVSTVWTNGQPDFGTDLDTTLVAYVVSGTAPDVIPQSQANIDVISNTVEVTFRISGTAADPAGSASTSTTGRGATTTTAASARATTTTARPASTTVATAAPTTRSTPVTTATTVPATTTTTKFLGIF